MANTRVLSVTKLQANDSIADFALDSPVAGYESGKYVIAVRGRLASRRPVEVVLRSQGRKMRTLQTSPVAADSAIPPAGAKADRPSAGDLHRAVFEGEVGVAGFSPAYPLQICAVVDETTTVPLAKIVVETSVPRREDDTGMAPLLVTSLARCGTTLLMRLLSEHPKLVACRQYPYEMRIAQYLGHLFRVLTDTANHVDSAAPDLFYDDWHWVGNNPFFPDRYGDAHDWFAGRFSAQLAEFTRSQVLDFYRQAAARQDRAGVAYFLEKADVANFHRHVMSFLFPATRELYLVRDPRDMLCSIIAFNRKRGETAFGMAAATSPRDYIPELGRMMKTFVAEWRIHRADALLLRYEDLIRDSAGALASVLDYLGLQQDRSQVESMINRVREDGAMLDLHRSSDSPPESIGRWKKELDAELQALCDAECREFAEAFGYA